MNNHSSDLLGESIDGREHRDSDDLLNDWGSVAALADKMGSEELCTDRGAAEGMAVDEEKSKKNDRGSLRRIREKMRLVSGGFEIRNTGGDSKNGGVVIEARKGLFKRRVGVGVLNADYGDEEAAILNAVHVKPRYRGKGIGSAITKEAIEQAKREKLKRVKLNSTDMAVGMYANQGFEVSDASSGAMVLELDGNDEEGE